MGLLLSSDFASKYPFSNAAKALLREVGREAVNTDKLRRAGERLIGVLQGTPLPTISSRERAVDYALARLVLACWDRPSVTWKFARRLAIRGLKAIDDEDLEALGKDFFPSLETSGDEYVVSLPEFANGGGELLYAPLEKGKIFLERGDFEGLLRDAAAHRIADISFPRKDIPAMVFEVAKEFEPRIPRDPSQQRHAGKYMALPCIVKIAAGMPEGKRYYGAMALSIASVKDGLPREDAEKILRQYVENCVKGSQAYTPREALITLDWVYKHPSIGFSCKRMKEQGIIVDCRECALGRQRVAKK